MPRGFLLGSNAASVASAAPSGAAGGDLSGTYPNPTVAKLNGVAAAAYAPKASPVFTGTVDASGATVTLPSGLVLPASVVIPSTAVATTQSAADGSTKVATTAYVDTADALKANTASPTFTGTVTLPGNPTSDLHATPKQWIDNTPGQAQFNALLGQSLSIDAGIAAASGTTVTATKYVMRVKIVKEAASGTRTIYYGVTAGGTSLTSTQNLIAVYNSSGTQIGSTSADQTTNFGSVGLKSCTVGTFAVAIGDIIYIEILPTFTGTAPQFCGVGTTGALVLNAGLSGANLRASTNGTGASVDASITPGSLSNAGVARVFWFGIA